MKTMLSVGFEVFGSVQGASFRKYAREFAFCHGVRGWMRETQRRSVEGVLEGEDRSVRLMKLWLQKVGCPGSKIAYTQFTDQKRIDGFSYSDFSIRKPQKDLKTGMLIKR